MRHRPGFIWRHILLLCVCSALTSFASTKNQRVEPSVTGPLPVFATSRNQSVEMPPLAPGAFPVACSNLAHDTARLAQLGGTIDDYWSGANDHYVGDILLEPASTLKAYNAPSPPRYRERMRCSPSSTNSSLRSAT